MDNEGTGNPQRFRIASRFSNTTESAVGAGNPSNGFIAINRFEDSTAQYRMNGATYSLSVTAQTPNANNLNIFTRIPLGNYGTHRIAFYSIGESLDLALLDARVTALINAYAAAIP